jgi:hypothetical protein
MAVANTKSTAITNADATPRVFNPPHLVRGPSFEAVGVAAALAADGAASVYRFVRIRSSDRISSIKLACDAMSGATSWSLGLYDTLANGGAAVSAALFVSVVDYHTGLGFTQVNFSNVSIANAEKRIWELLALSKDPIKDYDLCVTLNNAPVQAGNIAVAVAGTNGN